MSNNSAHHSLSLTVNLSWKKTKAIREADARHRHMGREGGGDFTVAMEIHRPKVSHQNRVSGWIDRKGKSNVIGFPGYPTDRSKKTHHKEIQTMLMVFKGRRYT